MTAPETPPVPGADDDLRTAIARRLAHADGNRWHDEPREGAFPPPLAAPHWWLRMADAAIEVMGARPASPGERRAYAHVLPMVPTGRSMRLGRDRQVRLDYGLVDVEGGGKREEIVGVEVLGVHTVDVDGRTYGVTR